MTMNSILSIVPTMVLSIVVTRATCIPRNLWKTLPVVHISSTLGVFSITVCAQVIVRLKMVFRLFSVWYSGLVLVNRLRSSMTLTFKVS